MCEERDFSPEVLGQIFVYFFGLYGIIGTATALLYIKANYSIIKYDGIEGLCFISGMYYCYSTVITFWLILIIAALSYYLNKKNSNIQDPNQAA